jgi:hypothetical protein
LPAPSSVQRCRSCCGLPASTTTEDSFARHGGTCCNIGCSFPLHKPHSTLGDSATNRSVFTPCFLWAIHVVGCSHTACGSLGWRSLKRGCPTLTIFVRSDHIVFELPHASWVVMRCDPCLGVGKCRNRLRLRVENTYGACCSSCRNDGALATPVHTIQTT